MTVISSSGHREVPPPKRRMSGTKILFGLALLPLLFAMNFIALAAILDEPRFGWIFACLSVPMTLFMGWFWRKIDD